MYDPVTPTSSMAPALLSVDISLIKRQVCQIFGLRAAPESGKRLICSVVFYNVKCVLKNINTAQYWSRISNQMSVLKHVPNHVLSLIFSYKRLVGSHVPLFRSSFSLIRIQDNKLPLFVVWGESIIMLAEYILAPEIS